METSLCESIAQSWTDEEIIERVLGGEVALYELLVRRYNQRVYRAVRAILRDDSEAEDVMQDAHVAAFQHLDEFEGRAAFSTWLTKIAVHEALARVKKLKRFEPRDFTEDESVIGIKEDDVSPESATATAETRVLLEEAILSLPIPYRSVLVMRDVEEMSTLETASALDLTEDAVKVRLHRARAMLRKELYARVGARASSAFQFGATRCDRVTQIVMSRILAE
ncbi:MAG TPA: RNA polymerase sigma factor [Terriglobales bacterium]|nr:RNA polymerase sigma factor [Terriglobales bacterium]